MKVSLNTIKQFIDFELPPVDELVARINAQLGGVEEVIDLSEKYKDAKIVKVVECEKHPNADKLSVCMVDAGTGELIQIVCGANNVHADMWAVWLPPKSTVPATFNDAEPFVLSAREIRGVVSNGMLASAKELAIGDDHDGIVDITEADVPKGRLLSAGASFAETFGLNDTIIDIENKMFTHRPDLFGQLGVAREIAGIFCKQFTSPEWYMTAPEFGVPTETLPLEVFNEASEKAPRFMAIVMKDVEVKQSPLWLKCALVAMGGKPINTIVDATNYIMLLTAQPTHAYDYDKIRGGRLGVRMARDGEKLQLLNGKIYELTSDDIVIADGEGAVGLAGIMGGGNSEVSLDTKNIVLEVANFDMYAVRKSSMRHGLFTDALTRFNKGQSPFQNSYILKLLMECVTDISSGKQASEAFDAGDFNEDCIFVYSDDPGVSEQHSFASMGVTEKFIGDRLGIPLTQENIAKLLGNVEFKVKIDNDGLGIHHPFWRTDIDEPEDIVEEVGRLYGYDKLPRELPHRTSKPTQLNPSRELARRLRSILSRAGANEVLTYSFVHEHVIRSAGQDAADAYRLLNALSPDLQYYRLSLTPSLLDKVHTNSKAGYDEFMLFEIGKSHGKTLGVDEQSLPLEQQSLALTYASKNTKQGAAFYRAKAVLDFMMDQLGIDVIFEQLSGVSSSSVTMPFEPVRSAIVSDKQTGLPIGIIGEYKKTVARNFKLPEYSAGFELDREALLTLGEKSPVQYRPLSRFPSVERDISLKTKKELPHIAIVSAIENGFETSNLEVAITPVGVYQPEAAGTKNTTVRIKLTAHDRTLTSEEVNKIISNAINQLSSSIGAEVV